MKLIQKTMLSVLCIPLCTQATPLSLPHFKQVVIWGHKPHTDTYSYKGHQLHTHSHSYIHDAFERAFRYLGYKTLWLDNKDDIREKDFSDSLFITEGQADQNIPLRDDCRYILHNCDMQKYTQLFEAGNCIILQVYSHDCLKRNDQKIGPCTHIDRAHKVIYMPWATDLLPHEIDIIKKGIQKQRKENAVYMVGCIWGGTSQFENKTKHDAFRMACIQNNTKWANPVDISAQDHRRLIQKSRVAPAIQSQWQCDNGYIPCRIFKNISYGQWGATNSRTVWDLFNKKIVFNEDTYQLFFDACKQAQEGTLEQLYEQIDFVRDNHTYLNRIETLFWFMNEVKPFAER